MIRGIILLIVAPGLFVGAAITIFGLLAPLIPPFEMINHFRPFILGGFIVLLLLVLPLRRGRWLIPVSAFAMLNGALFVLPIIFQATPAPAAQPSAAAMKIVSFNIWVGNRSHDEIEAFLRRENADVVLLQEIEAESAKALLPRLRDLYPHQLSCAERRGCRLALLSRTPWSEADRIDLSYDNPALIWARFGDGAGSYRIAGLHSAWPFLAHVQKQHMDWLTAWRRNVDEPLLIAGDFNLTPFSWNLTRFTWNTGLKRYSTFQRSWPGHRYAPVFLIDHIFSTDGFRPIDVHTGPASGSDHLPVIATVFRSAG